MTPTIIRLLNQAYTLGHNAADNSHPLTHEQAEQRMDKLREEAITTTAQTPNDGTAGTRLGGISS